MVSPVHVCRRHHPLCATSSGWCAPNVILCGKRHVGHIYCVSLVRRCTMQRLPLRVTQLPDDCIAIVHFFECCNAIVQFCAKIAFSHGKALTGKPKKKLYFSQYCWKRCAIGAKYDYATALSRPEWQQALFHGDLPSLQQEDCKDPLIFSPYYNTEFLNVAAYMEAFWSYIWPTASHNNVPPHDEWRTIKHGGLKEFIDHIVSTFSRPQLKPTTECLRGVTTYPSGDQRQGRYSMTLTDLMNNHYTRAVREVSLDLILGRSDDIVKVGDLVEVLLGISFCVKDAMLDWEWLGIDPVEWPPQVWIGRCTGLNT